ncbi:serine/threonine-protein kinase [Cryptosporangium phraense]|uniref:non-specific serine/threonine protein kinase n=1 Tax=Cryptosporangium phraense TaxID=2593070 RepID=A0A545AI35_9ACTN|nr:serine/threonine-protein kinase [Cryptosporangium phraense]TQS40987.1 protein kinase [Cryptosporangium phraense]
MTDGANGQLVGGRYRLGPHLGSGGMGTVWRATDDLLHRDVAVKEVPIPHGLPDDEAERLRERYLREARAAARLRHAGVVGVYDVLPEPDRVWIVMEFIAARNLAEILRQDGPMSPERAAVLGLQVLDALDHAHRAGVLHRDVKPANVLVDHEERAVLTDFGVASVSGDASLTRTGHLVGSPAYLSPERLTGGTVGPPADLWALGCTLFAAVEGKSPFARDEHFAVITAITLEPVPPAHRAGNLGPVIAGLLDKDPGQRWDAVRTRAGLRRVADGRPVENLSATSWGTPPVTGDFWMPSDPGGPASGSAVVNGGPTAPVSGSAPVSGTAPISGTPAEYRLDAGSPGGEWSRSRPDWNQAPRVPDLSGPRPLAGSPGVDLTARQVSGGATRPASAPPSGPGPAPSKSGGSRVGLWLLAALVVVLLAGGAGVVARKNGWLDLSGGSTPTESPTATAPPTSGEPSSTAPTGKPTGKKFDGNLYSLTYPTTWNQYCLTDPGEIEKQEHSGCYFDQLAADQHTDDNTDLRRSPYVLVIVGDAKGRTPLEQLQGEETFAREKGAFPDYQRVALQEASYGDHQGAVLEFTHRGAVIDQPNRVRIFRFNDGDKFYEISLRSPQASYDDFLAGFEQIAGSLTPK